MHADIIKKKIEDRSLRIGVIGLGYVGLPLAGEFGKYFTTIGFDINAKRIEELTQGHDRTLEMSDEELKAAVKLEYTTSLEDLKKADVFIVTVPTPVDDHKIPDLTPLVKASESVGKVLSPGNIVVYESTVYPGCTEQDCVPILEKFSQLKFNQDFFAGYSPERINPGDKQHRVFSIKKVTSGSTPEIAAVVDMLYAVIITAGTHRASSIKAAEAAKVIENTQRDINIAFVNELAMLFDKMGIDTLDVLEAAGTKWNFLPFRPGLVGGHCIGVDPYYLTHRARSIGYHPEIILAGRRINDGMGAFVAGKVVKHLIKTHKKVDGAKILLLGITFKEDCPDSRNSKVIDIIDELKSFGCQVDVFDPVADPDEVEREYRLDLFTGEDQIAETYDAVVLAVAHKEFRQFNFLKFKNSGSVIYDVKSFLPVELVDARL